MMTSVQLQQHRERVNNQLSEIMALTEKMRSKLSKWPPGAILMEIDVLKHLTKVLETTERSGQETHERPD